MALLELKNVSLSYHTKAGQTDALGGIDIAVERGEFVAIVGPSGCGKTTILSLVAGLMKPSGGEILLDGAVVERPGGDVGYCLQRDSLFEWLTIEKNAVIGLKMQKKLTDDTRRYAADLLEKYGLKEFAKAYPNQLSGGMRQRAALIRTLAFRPKMLLLDEPFSALDYQTRLEVAADVGNIIKQEHLTALLVTHDISEAITLASRVYILTPRPAKVKKIVPIRLEGNSLERRADKDFGKYFDAIWKDLQT